MKYKARWEKIDSIGEGGQGKVFRVLDRNKVSLDSFAFSRAIKTALEITEHADTIRKIEEHVAESRRTGSLTASEQIQKSINEFVRAQDPINHGALKILHPPNEARNSKDAEERLQREMQAMKQTSHPNLLKIEDYNCDHDEKWFVSKYYPNGTLKCRSDWFTGQVERTLTAIRPIVHGVATLHGKKIVHRDIKPENIFVDENEQLVLGDFGLVYFTDGTHTRLSGTVENVGSYDWMPPWAMRKRIEEVKPSCDVFSLGKTIWSMVSSKSIALPLWYHREEEYNVQRMFPRDPAMEFLNRILDKCIVEKEKDCLTDASYLLVQIDDTLRALELGAAPIGDEFARPCRVCGFGVYRQIADIKDEHRTSTRGFGLEPKGSAGFNIFICSHCGHVQLFFGIDRKYPTAWEDA